MREAVAEMHDIGASSRMIGKTIGVIDGPRFQTKPPEMKAATPPR